MMSRLSYYLCYSLVLTAALPLVLVRLLVKSIRQPEYRKRITERFGKVSLPQYPNHHLWLHAVSLGEIIAARPMVDGLLAQGRRICITTTTASGSQYVQKHLRQTVTHCYCPYDLSFVINRFLSTIKPALLVIMETELWPNMINTASKHGIPVIIANARLSEKSFRRYYIVRFVLRTMLAQLHTVYAQTVHDQQRWLQLGLPTTSCQVLGNMKCDLPSVDGHADNTLEPAFFEHRPVWLAASTHPGEEELLLSVFAHIKQEIPTLVMILVPRHPERLNRLIPTLKRSGLSWQTRQDQPHYQQTDIFVLNTFGELNQFYPLADIVFVGGSLVPHGGQNVLEPIRFSKPVITGPHTHNFSFIITALTEQKAILEVRNEGELYQALRAFFAAPASLKTMVTNATHVVRQHRGSVAAHIDAIQKVISNQCIS